MNLRLENKTALVTGSTMGIGLAIARALAEEGARVVINGRTSERVEKAMERLKEDDASAQVSGIDADLGTAEGCAKIVKQLPEVDILVNNVGIFEPKPFEEIPDEDWQRLIDVNVMSGVRLSRAYLPGMKKQGWGRIVFISSESGLQIPVEMVHYGVTKTAQVAVARGIAEGCAGTEVTANSVLVGPTASEGVATFVQTLATQQGLTKEEFEKEFFRSARPTSLIKRFLKPEEIAEVVAFLCSPAASAINGAAVRAEGGLLKGAF